MSTPIDTLKQIEARLEEIKPSLQEELEQDDRDLCKARFDAELRSICSLIRKIENEFESGRCSSEIWNALLVEAQRITDDVAEFTSGDDEPYPYLPSYADTDTSPLIKDPFEQSQNALGSGLIDSFLHFFKELDPTIVHRLPKIPLFDPALKPHTLTSKIARFREHSAPRARSFDSTKTRAHMIYQARCEAELMPIPRPVGRLCIAEAEEVLAILGRSGWKERDPSLSVYDISGGELMMPGEPQLGFQGIAADCVLNGPNRLLAVGDKAEKSRVKVWKWAPNDVTRLGKLHTLASGVCKGPMATMGNNLIRAGKGAARVWDLTKTATHGPSGANRIGRRLDVSDC